MQENELSPEAQQKAQQLQLIQHQFQQLLMMSAALNGMSISLSNTLSLPFSGVASYEGVSPNENLEKAVPLLTLSNGREVELTVKQNKIFQPIWNEKAAIDRKLLSIVATLRRELFPETAAAPAAPTAGQLQP